MAVVGAVAAVVSALTAAGTGANQAHNSLEAQQAAHHDSTQQSEDLALQQTNMKNQTAKDDAKQAGIVGLARQKAIASSAVGSNYNNTLGAGAGQSNDTSGVAGGKQLLGL